jgi:sortase A
MTTTTQKARRPAQARPRRSSLRRVILAMAWLLILGGLGLLGWIGWIMFGTNIASERAHADGIGAIERRWRSGQDTAVTPRGEVVAIVRIPALGDKYAVPVLEGTSEEVLAAGYGHFDSSAAAGARGNFALAAHRVTHGEPLRRMPELEAGDQVIVDTRRARYTYVLDTDGDDLEVPFTETWVLDRLPTNPAGGVQPQQRRGQRLITLTTCAEIFHTDGRLIAFGHLVDREPRK